MVVIAIAAVGGELARWAGGSHAAPGGCERDELHRAPSDLAGYTVGLHAVGPEPSQAPETTRGSGGLSFGWAKGAAHGASGHAAGSGGQAISLAVKIASHVDAGA